MASVADDDKVRFHLINIEAHLNALSEAHRKLKRAHPGDRDVRSVGDAYDGLNAHGSQLLFRLRELKKG